jgi:hypothetical protein
MKRGSIHSSLMMEAARTSETSVDNYFTRQYIPEDNSEQERFRYWKLISNAKYTKKETECRNGGNLK